MRMLSMRWTDLAFFHWPVSESALRSLVPTPLQVDTFRDTAWIGITPFRMERVRPVFTPSVPTASDFPELNVRTYVRHGSRTGVFFFSLDAASWLAVQAARLVTGLPYHHARMNARRFAGDIEYQSRRVDAGSSPAEFRARYRPTGSAFRAEPGSLVHFLTERYSLFVAPARRLLRLDIEHEPWTLQPASAEIERNTMASATGIDLPSDKPHVCFSDKLDVTAHWPVPAD